MFQPPICKNDKCSKLVPPSKNPGKERLFCTTRCARQFHARRQYQKETAAAPVFVNDLGQAQVNRRMSRTSKAADQRYKAHLVHCFFHRGPCPARSDPYGRKRLCLVAATFIDDWTQLMDAEEGKVGKRYATTVDGRWIADLTEAEMAAIDRQTGGDGYMTEDVRQAALAAGAGTVEVGLNGTDAAALARYNEGLPLSS